MFPKDKPILNGDFAILSVEVVNHIKGDKPIRNRSYDTVSLKGTVPALEEGDVITMMFDNPESNKFGTTYEIVGTTKEINPNNKKELKEYLEFMCGSAISKELMALDNPYELLQQKNSEELLKVKGIKETRLEQIYEKIDSFSDISYALVKLSPLGLTNNQIKNICSAVGGSSSAVEICFNRPYDLVGKVKGMGFKIVDEVAIKCGMNPFAPTRIRSAVSYILSECGENGKSFLYAPQLLQEIKKIVSIEFYTLDAMVRDMIKDKELVVSEDGMMVALPYYIKLEQDIAKELNRLMGAKSHIKTPENWIDIVREIEEKQGWVHTDEQMDGIEMSLENNVIIVSGKAGSGKSTVTNAMSEVLKRYNISLCCLSAKASQRLREVTGMDASTIHKLLGIGKEDDDEGEELYSDIVIIDESSMISGSLFLKLLKKIRNGSKVVILGDDGQLTAIGNCAVFSDAILSKAIPHIELTKIHRQAEKSAIITKSIDFRNQVPICEKGFSGHMIMGELQDLELYVLEQELLLHQVKQEFLKNYKEVGDILEVQIISALKTRGGLSIQNINSEIQQLVNPKVGDSFEGANKTQIFVGDKVINMKNNYKAKDVDNKKVGVWNGSIGVVEKIEKKNITINFVGIGKIVLEKDCYKNINLAYAISCHSSQGSQWKRVICTFDMSAYVLLNVELVYTALTRASEHCVMVIERKALEHSARTVEQKTKQTLLSKFLN